MKSETLASPVSLHSVAQQAGVSIRPHLVRRDACGQFRLTSGALYAFWITPDTNGASHGYVAAGGPEFDGPTDTVGGK